MNKDQMKLIESKAADIQAEVITEAHANTDEVRQSVKDFNSAAHQASASGNKRNELGKAVFKTMVSIAQVIKGKGYSVDPQYKSGSRDVTELELVVREVLTNFATNACQCKSADLSKTVKQNISDIAICAGMDIELLDAEGNERGRSSLNNERSDINKRTDEGDAVSLSLALDDVRKAMHSARESIINGNEAEREAGKAIYADLETRVIDTLNQLKRDINVTAAEAELDDSNEDKQAANA